MGKKRSFGGWGIAKRSLATRGWFGLSALASFRYFFVLGSWLRLVWFAALVLKADRLP